MFSSRIEAGELLARALESQQIKADLVLGIPRGGVEVAAQIAAHLRLPLDVLLVKKLGAPGNPELAIGAIAQDGIEYIDHTVAASLRVDKDFIAQEKQQKLHELHQREQLLRTQKQRLPVKDQQIILVDDGVATGATFFAGITWLRGQNAAAIIAALPVVAFDVGKAIRQRVDQYVILEEPQNLHAVGAWYKDFHEVTDEDVIKLLQTN